MKQALSPSVTFLIQKYNLDISIVEIKNIRESRLDSDFYSISRKDFDESKDFMYLVDFTDFIKKGIFDISPSNYVQEFWVPFIRSWDLKDSFVWWEWVIQINKKSHLQEIKTELEIGDMLISKVWTIWDVALNLDYEKLNFSQNVIWIKVKSEYKKISGYLIAFLNSKPWREQIKRKISWQVQFKITLEDIRTLKIPLPSPTFQSRITELIQETHMQRELSKSLYAEAEQILLSELGLIDWIPIEVSITEKMSEEVRLFGRCDAEFFQPKYDELFGRLSKFQTQKLGDIADYQKWVEPWADAYSETGIPFIRVADVSIEGIDTIEKNISQELLTEYGERYSPKKDEILFTKDWTIGISFVVNEDMRAVLSGAFLRLQKKIDIESEYLALVLNSVISKMQIERFSGWAIIAHLKPSDAMELLIPILSLDIQSHISSRIIASHSAREQSKTLLERAKRAVEIFIEEDEASAEIFLNQGTII